MRAAIPAISGISFSVAIISFGSNKCQATNSSLSGFFKPCMVTFITPMNYANKAAMKKALLFLFIIQLHLCTNAQNKILFRIDSTHSGNIMSGGDAEGMAGNSAIRGFDHHVSPAPGELTNSFPSDYDFPKGLNSLLNSFQLEHLIYHEIR